MTASTEPGSSGSGIFKADTQQLFGQLFFGPSSCNASAADRFDCYGAFSTTYARIKNFLKAGSDDNSEQNDSCARARNVGKGTLNGRIVKVNDPDWYKISCWYKTVKQYVVSGYTTRIAGIPDAHQVRQIHERPDGRQLALFRQAPEERLAAERYCVGSTPKPRNTFRQAASVGSSLRGVSPIRSRAASVSSWKAAARPGGVGSLWTPVAWMTPATIVGKRSMMPGSYRKRATDPVSQMSGGARPRQGLGPSSPGCADPDDAGGELHQLEAPTPLIR